jgi:hypothetical protein
VNELTREGNPGLLGLPEASLSPHVCNLKRDLDESSKSMEQGLVGPTETIPSILPYATRYGEVPTLLDTVDPFWNTLEQLGMVCTQNTACVQVHHSSSNTH